MIEDALRTLLIEPGTATADLVGSRVYPERLPQGADNKASPLPAITYFVVDAPRAYHHKGPSFNVRARIQLDLYGEKYSDAQKLRRAIVGTKAVPGVLSGRQAVVEIEGEEHTVAIRRIFVRMERDSGESDLDNTGGSPRHKSLDLEVWFWET